MKRRHEIVRRAREFKRRRQTRRVVFILSGVVLILLAAFFLLRSDRWVIDRVVVSGSKSVAQADIESAVREGLAGRYLWFFSKGSIFWYPKDQITASLLQQFSNLARVELRLINVNTLAVLAEERRGKFVWCPAEIEILGIERERLTCYFADESGLIFSTAPSLSGNVFLEFSGPLPSDPVGRRPLPEEKFRQIIGFEKEFAGWLDSLVTRRVVIGEDGDFEFALRQPNRESDKRVLRLLFNTGQNLSGAVANLRSALAAEELQKIFRADPLALEYIDLRFPPKVFYKIRQ